MNDRVLARAFFDHHAHETDRRSQRRLNELMRRARDHDRTCTTTDCPVKLHSFIAGDVVAHTAFNEQLLQHGIVRELDGARQEMIGSRTILRVYFPQTGKAMNGLLLELNAAALGKAKP